MALLATLTPTCVAVLGALVMWRVVVETAATALRGAPVAPADALVGALAGVGVILIAWMTLGVALEALALLPGALGRAARGASAALSPRIVRRSMAVLLTVGVGAGIGTGGAQAAPARAAHAAVQQLAESIVDGSEPPAADAPGAHSLPDPGWSAPPPDPGWTPTAPVVRPQPDLATLGGRTGQQDLDEVVVQRGDSLWVIAARHLGDGASDAEIAAAWPRWYAANREVVGPEPDLLRPGQVLRVPFRAAP